MSKRMGGNLASLMDKRNKLEKDTAQTKSSAALNKNKNPFLSKPIQPGQTLQMFLVQARRSALNYEPTKPPFTKPFCEIEARIGVLKINDRRVTSSGPKRINNALVQAFDCTSLQQKPSMESGVSRSHYVHWTQAGLSEASPISAALGVMVKPNMPNKEVVAMIKRDLVEKELVETVFAGYPGDRRVAFPCIVPLNGKLPDSTTVGAMEYKEKLVQMEWAIPAAKYDFRVALASEKTVDKSVKSVPDGWSIQRIKRRRSYTRRDGNIAWQIDVTEITSTPRDSPHKKTVLFEIEMELRAENMLKLLNAESTEKASGLAKAYSQQLWWILGQINPLEDTVDVEEYLQPHPNKKAVQLALATCGALKRFMERPPAPGSKAQPVHMDAPISKPNEAPSPALSNVKFCGCMPVNFARHNIDEIQQSAKNAYFLSEKTDGVRHFMIFTDRLEPASTPRTIEDNPQSILRKRYPGSINDHDYLIEPTPVDFRDGSGMSLSPIENRTSPAQPQHQNMRTAQPAKSADESDLMSIAYSEFIESVAAVVIQTTVRRFLAKLLVDKLRVQVAAARKYRYNRKRIEGKTITPRPVKVPSVQRTSVQSRSRNRVQQLQQEEESMANTGMEYQLFVFAAIRIQSVFRGWFVRDIIKIEHYCATIIQKNARGLVYRNQYQYDLFRIIMAQSVVRRFLVCRDLYVVAPDPEVRRVLDFAAAMIQARWRGFVAEMRYFQNYRDVLLVQSVVRRWLAIRLVRAIQSLDQHQQKKSTGNNRFGKYGARHSLGNVRVHAHEPVPVVPVQPKSTGTHTSSKWSNTRNVPWQQPSSSSNTTITHSASTEERGSTTSQAKHDVPTGMGSIAKRRAMFESKRLNTVQQEDASKEKAAAAKAELKAMQRKVGVRPSPGTQSISSHPQRAKSMSGRIQNPLSKKNWGPDFRPNTKVVGRVSTFESSSGSVVASDVETEVQSNRTSTSRLLQGWRDREKSNSFDQRNSFDMTSERATTTATEYHGRSSNTRLSTGTIGLSKYLGGKTEHQEAVAPLSHGGGMVHRPPNPSHEQCSNPNSDPEPSFQDIMRSKRSPKESIRIQQIEEVFIKVGLMRPVNRPLLNANVGQPQPSKVERTYLSSPLRKVNNTKVEQSPSGTQAMKNQLPWRVQPSRSLDSSSPKTERKLFHDEPDSGNDNGNSSNEQAQSQAALKIWRNARQPPHANSNSNSNSSRAQQLPPRQQQQQSSGVERRSLGGVGVGANPSPVNERSKNLLNSLGINTSYTSEVSTDVSDMENSPSPAFLRRFQKVTPDSPVPKTNLFGAPEVQSQNKVVSTVNQNHPQRPVFSQFQIQKQAERSQEDQIKIDAMHAVFEKVGLMKSVASIYLYTVVDNE